MQGERERRALTKIQCALERDFRLFKSAHADRAMRGAQTKEVFFDLQARATSEIAVASLRDLENR